jgi:hypothetical protein
MLMRDIKRKSGRRIRPLKEAAKDERETFGRKQIIGDKGLMCRAGSR